MNFFKKNKRILIASSVVLIFLFALVFISSRSFSFWRTYYFFFPPENFFNEKLIDENFSDLRLGQSVVYYPKFKYPYEYVVGISIDDKKIHSEYDSKDKFKYSGKFKIELLKNSQPIDEKNIDENSYTAGTYYDNTNYYKTLDWAFFDVPLNIDSADYSIRITMLEVDKKLEENRDSIKLYVSASYMP